MEKKQYEYPLPIGTIIQGGIMPGSDGERYQYRIDEVLGQGGYGLTYKVSSRVKLNNIWLKERQIFAMKEHFVKGHCYRGTDGVRMEYSKASAPDVEDSLKDFLREGKRLSDICKGCLNIVDVNEVITTNNTAYYVMEYIEGGDLRTLVKKAQSGIEEKRAVKIISEIGKAIEYIHKQKILHLDIKPENIVLGKDLNGNELPVLIDFGVSRHFTCNGSMTTTHKDAFCSAGFAPQEQYAGITKFAPEADVYALGGTLFYLLVGRDPKSAFDRIPGDVEKALPSSISSSTKEAIANAMKIHAYERTKSVAAFIAALNNKKEKESVQKEYLLSGAIIKGGLVDYQILNLQEKGTCFLKYKGTRYADIRSGGNTTVKANYTIYEYFVSGIHKRNANSTIETKFVNAVSRTEFLNLAKKETGLSLDNKDKVADNSHNHEIFKANGTIYFIVKDGSKIEEPSPHDEPIDKPDPNIIITESNKGMIIAAAIIGAFILLGIIFYNSSSKTDASDIASVADTIEYEDSVDGEGEETSDISEIIEEPIAEEPTKTEEKKEPEKPKVTDEELFYQASRKSDWTAMLSLARKGYEPACGAMAKHYVSSSATSENHCRAYYWAQQSSREDKAYVIDVLTKYGFLVDGRPVTECDDRIKY